MNLLTNARDALNDTFPQSDPRKRIHLSATLKLSGEERWIRIGVEDWGPGIPDQLREKIFDPFFTTKPHDKGTGLGLWIVYGILKEHGARIELESEVGRFTRFWVDLPVRGEAPWVPV
jgi:signal transduction histidine kinase